MRFLYLVVTYEITLSGGYLGDNYTWWLLTRLLYLVVFVCFPGKNK